MNIDKKLISALGAIQEETNIEYINDIIELIKSDQLYREKINDILKTHNIVSYKDAKEEFLDLIIHYINCVLLDDIIDEIEYYNVTQLKRLFKIKDDDFYKLRYDEIEEIIMKQIFRIYEDNQIEKLEAIHKSKLQGLFDLSYDQINKIVTDEVERALMQGGDITKLDAYYKMPNTPNFSDDSPDKVISKEVKDLVWKRDGGKCGKCGSSIGLEFNHITPFFKGGSNTFRNIQLLCEKCNRLKSTKF
ncbi:MAG: HNH endonuclease signature motif containing protein [Bacteroidales bacterium]|nr:HNH endonuclease signature motif containing protein [Bacteroidales bacterium]MDY0216092.1 HNH endonuclease signature motif containing protein [Bacteroidales bacterium]